MKTTTTVIIEEKAREFWEASKEKRLPFMDGAVWAFDQVLDRCAEGGGVLAMFAQDLCHEFDLVPLAEREGKS